MKKIFLAAITVLLIISGSSTVLARAEKPVEETYVKAQVNQVKEEKIQIHSDDPLYDPSIEGTQYNTIQKVTYEVLEGDHKGIIFESENELSNRIYDLDLKKGDKVMLLLKVYEDRTYSGFATDFIRSNIILVLIILFIGALILIGKLKGLRALVSLVITVGSIFFVLIPLTLQGHDPLLIAFLIAVFVTIATILLISGINKKAISAIIGTLGGVLLAILIAYIAGNASMLTGLSGEDARILYINRPELDFMNIFFASVLIGALGAVMDIGMSISSAVHEVSEANPKAGKKKLFKSGMNVGKDIMGTMSNTLILAYAGSAFPLLLLFSLNEFSAMQVINFDFMAAEIIRAISGSFGLLLAIPITAFVGSLLRKGRL
jgi:uncharacterized membrane protein